MSGQKLKTIFNIYDKMFWLVLIGRYSTFFLTMDVCRLIYRKNGEFSSCCILNFSVNSLVRKSYEFFTIQPFSIQNKLFFLETFTLGPSIKDVVSF
jgi:hypothetical protein